MITSSLVMMILWMIDSSMASSVSCSALHGVFTVYYLHSPRVQVWSLDGFHGLRQFIGCMRVVCWLYWISFEHLIFTSQYMYNLTQDLMKLLVEKYLVF